MNLEDIVRRYVEENYDLIDARSKVTQDIILSKISKCRFKSNVYKSNIADPKNNRLDIPINDAINSVLNYIEELS